MKRTLSRFLPVLAAVFASGLQATVIPSDSAHIVLLNGTWRFKLEQAGERPDTDHPGAPPKIVLPAHFEPFERLDYSENRTWHDLTVPGNWEMAGFSPATYWQPDNAIGLYRLRFDVPAAWRGRTVKLNFDGVQNGAEIYLNGRPVGVSEPAWGRKNYHEGGWDAFQVDLTPAVRFGAQNLLAVRVYKNTRSAELDSGDYFFLGGIYRTVTLFSVPPRHLEDLTVQTTLRDGGGAEVRVLLDTGSGEAGASASIQLQGDAPVEGHPDPEGRIELRQFVAQPRLWSAEHPNLYDLSVDLRDARGKITEHVSRRVGIRQVTIEHGVLMVNHVPVKLAGMCRHDLYPTVGTALDESIWRKDLALMKAANVNAVRTSHYPYGSKFYDLCDEMGFYVADEMAACWCPTDTDELTPAFAQHARELVGRDKNHACVIIWAIGNENKKGKNDKVAADQIRALDPTRPRLVSRQDAEEAGVEIDDRHYPTPATLGRANAASRRSVYPIISLENPNIWEERNGADYGSLDLWVNVLDRTWREIWKDEHIPGSFLWEWRDRAIADPGPVRYYAYDPATGISYVKTKGVCDGFGHPRAEYYHVKVVYAPLKVQPEIGLGHASVTLDVTNHYSFTDLSELAVVWHLTRAGRELDSAVAHLSLAPLTRSKLALALPSSALARADALRLDFDQPDGRNVVTDQFSLGVQPQAVLPLDSSALAGIHFPHLNFVTVETNGWHWAHRHPGRLANLFLRCDGAGTTSAPIDEAALYSTPLSSVRAIDADVVLADSPEKPVAHVHADFLDGRFSYRLEWRGAKAEVQELGWAFEMPKKYEDFSWNRKAYWSWYPPLHVGRPEGTARPDSADVHFTKITRPDAFDFNSTKYDCNWAKLTDPAGEGVGVNFAADAREHCRGDFGPNGAYRLVVNRYCCPPKDISSSVVPDLYLTFSPHQEVEGRFEVGSIGRTP